MRPVIFHLLVLLLSLAGAQAHPLLQDSMWVVFAPERVRVAVNVSLREILVAQAGKNHAEPISPELDANALAEKHRDYLLQHLKLEVGDRPLDGRITKLTPPPTQGTDAESTMFQYELDYPLPTEGRPSQVRFSHDMLREFSYAPGQPWDVTYVMRLKRSDAADVATGLLRTQTPQDFPTGWSDPGAQPGPVNSSGMTGAYLHHGIMHILEGYDHLLFVAALVLAALGFWEMFKVIAAFTVAHTITLAVSSLTGFKLPAHIVEPIIAGSIVFVAVENIIWPQHARGWLRLAVAFAFGLVHGLGFAGGLRDSMSELGMNALVTALIAFSVGVELGHLVVVIPFFGLLKLGDWKFDGPFRRIALRYGSVIISIAGLYYLVNAVASA